MPKGTPKEKLRLISPFFDPPRVPKKTQTMARTMKNEGQLGSGDCWWLVLWVWFLSLTSHTLHSSASGVSLSRRECSLIRSPVPRDANAYTAANEQTKEYTASVEGCTSAMLHQMFGNIYQIWDAPLRSSSVELSNHLQEPPAFHSFKPFITD